MQTHLASSTRHAKAVPENLALYRSKGKEHQQDLDGAYLSLQTKMQRSYMHDLLKIERLCVHLDILRPTDEVVQRLKTMLVKHIRPLIAQLKAPKIQVTEQELSHLLKMSTVLPPFLTELNENFREMRRSNSAAVLLALTTKYVTAAAA